VVVAGAQPAEIQPERQIDLMHLNDTTNAASEYDPPASVADIYSDLKAWEGAHHELRGEHVRATRHVGRRAIV